MTDTTTPTPLSVGPTYEETLRHDRLLHLSGMAHRPLPGGLFRRFNASPSQLHQSRRQSVSAGPTSSGVVDDGAEPPEYGYRHSHPRYRH